MTAPAISVRGLVKRFDGLTAVNGISLEVPRCAIVGFLGPNGSGKTTTLRMLCGLLTPDAGEGTCLGFDIRREADAIKRRVGYMTQHFGLYDDLTVEENLAFVARMYGMRPLRPRVEAIMTAHGLDEVRTSRAGTLSGGWKQRLALAACLVHDPELLLLDEPTAGVDPKARRAFWDLIHGAAARGLTVLVSTHYMDEAERCHRIAYLAWGDLLAEGTVAEVVAASGLKSVTVTGEGVEALRTALAGRPGVDAVAAFGATLRISGADPARLEAALAPFRADPRWRWADAEPTLEDVFVHALASGRRTPP